jgi:hypothetical protein
VPGTGWGHSLGGPSPPHSVMAGARGTHGAAGAEQLVWGEKGSPIAPRHMDCFPSAGSCGGGGG